MAITPKEVKKEILTNLEETRRGYNIYTSRD
jgi:hypothetical protein